ncbi:hypothetical protein M0Q28_06060 [Patescibacteria group bacterium]|nr:hypothetical protein [Patescibacteria group bacterium]
MSKKTILPTSRRHVMMFDEDWEWLEGQYGANSPSKIGVAEAVRIVVHNFCKRQREAVNARIDAASSGARSEE